MLRQAWFDGVRSSLPAFGLGRGGVTAAPDHSMTSSARAARPGGNLTGFTNFAPELTPKRLELLSELVPQAVVIALLVNPSSPTTERHIGEIQEAARAKGVRLSILKAGTESEIDAAFISLVELQAGALLVDSDRNW
jgi:putative ABC transport system substrate-binding protein